MDRQAHEYAAAMAFAQQQQQQQQQQQFGFHPQQQFPPSVHGPPFHPQQHQQYPFPRHMQPHQLHPHPPPPPHHLMHLQPQQHPMPGFPPHVPPHHVPSGFQAPYDSVPPPSDPELQKRIDKLVEYAVKVGPEFEIMIREKEKDNPAYNFLFGGEGHNYYRYKLWLTTQPTTGPSMPMMHPSSHMMNAPPLHQPPFPPFYDQQLHHQHPQAFLGHVRPDFDPGSRPFKGLAGPLPSDVAVELNNVLGSLTGTKESIKSAKAWFMQRSPFAPALAEALRDRMFAVDDSERQLHIVFLANDILFDSLTSRRSNPHDLDNEALAFKPVLGSMLARIYHNPQNKEENQSRLQKILQFWASKEVFDQETIRALENEMIGGPIINSVLGMPKELPSSASLNISAAGSRSQWHDRQQGLVPIIADKEHMDQQISPLPMMLTSPIPQNIIPTPGSLQPPLIHQPTVPSEKLPPYPLFPPGLIPGMVRKMQIGSGVPYSPMSPLDIPTVIPPSDVPQSEILERVSKFFKEIGEVNPSDGPMKSEENDDNDNDGYGRRVGGGGDTTPVRKGGACIPPPANLRGAVDPETGTYADGSVERKPGSSSSGRLGLGATADPNEVSQYDDVYSSYRKQRSSNYHTSMSARATTTSTGISTSTSSSSTK